MNVAKSTIEPPPQSDFEKEPARRTKLASAGIYAGLALAAGIQGIIAYHEVFFQEFGFGDDEGYVLITLKQFFQGHALYDEIFSQYGPFFYLSHWLLLKPSLGTLDHDHAGLLVIAIWLGCSLLNALTVHRLTGNFLLAIVTQIASFRVLEHLKTAPAHPQGLCILLVTLIPLLAAHSHPRWRTSICAVLGILVGGLLLTKINIGAFALLALALTFSAVTLGRVPKILGCLTGVAILALPCALMRRHLSESWAQHYAALVTLSAVPVVLVHWTGTSRGFLRPRDWIGALGGLSLALGAVSAGIILRGTSPSGFFHGVVLQNLRFANAFFMEAPLNPWGARAGAAGLLLYLLYRSLGRWADRPAVTVATYLAKAAFGAWVVFCSYQGWRGPMLVLGLPMVWLAVLPVAHEASRGIPQFARLVLISVTVLQSLVGYPVAGEQMAFATVLLDVAAAVCLHDVICAISQVLPQHLRNRVILGRIVCRTVSALLAAALIYGEFLSVLEWRGGFPLALPGADRLRVSENQAAGLRWLAYNLRTHADTFVTMPGYNSLYFWAEEEPPTCLNTTTWMTLLDDGQQQLIVDRLAAHPNACSIRMSPFIPFWVRDQPIDQKPLVRHINEDFRTVGRFGNYEFRIRKERAEPELLYCARWQRDSPRVAAGTERSALMVIPAMNGYQIHRMVLVDLASRTTLADTGAGPDGGQLALFAVGRGRKDTPVNLDARPIDLADGCRLSLRFQVRQNAAPPEMPLVRLFDRDGNWFASVPFVD